MWWIGDRTVLSREIYRFHRLCLKTRGETVIGRTRRGAKAYLLMKNVRLMCGIITCGNTAF